VFTIIGSGFGLYGYLPALCEGPGDTIILPERYREQVFARPELCDYLTHISWAKDEEDAWSQAHAAVVATCPERQQEIVLQLLNHPMLEKIVLEKPVAVSPEKAAAILAALKQEDKSCRVDYSFLNTAWHTDLKLAVKNMDAHQRVCVSWRFLAHHFKHEFDTWKRFHGQGGGVLRFFGIHLIALLADIGYDNVIESNLCGENQDQPEKWEAIFSAEGMPGCHVIVDSHSPEEHFTIMATDATDARTSLIALNNPFASEDSVGSSAMADNRIDPLIKLLRTFHEPDKQYDDLYKNVNDLWARVEAVSRYQGLPREGC